MIKNIKFSLPANVPFYRDGKMSRRRIVQTAKCPDGKLSQRRNVQTAKCPNGKLSRRRKVPTAKCPTANCPTAKCPTAKCPTTTQMKQYRMSGGSQGRTEPEDGNGPKRVACKATSLYRQFNAFTTSRSYSI